MSIASVLVEAWAPVVGCEGFYEVSDQGRVRSVSRPRSNGGRLTGRVLRLACCGANREYRKVGLWRDGVETQREVHVLVAAAFLGPRPAGQVVRHLDGDPTNNRVWNLAYGTQGENNRDAVRHGTHFWARRDACAHGHPYTPENLKTVPSRPGVRYCRACHKENGRRSRAGLVQNLRGPLPSRLLKPIPPEALR